MKIWRQKNAREKGHFETYKVSGIEEDTSFLEMLDILNEQLIMKGIDPVSFDHDCREGICGACSLYIDGRAHGPDDKVTTCQLFMRHFKNGATITVEPFRSAAFPVIKDLVVERKAFDKILQAGGFISVRTGSAQDANATLIRLRRYLPQWLRNALCGRARQLACPASAGPRRSRPPRKGYGGQDGRAWLWQLHQHARL